MAFKKSVQISGGGNDCIEGILHVTKETCIEAIEGTWRLLWSQTLLRSQGKNAVNTFEIKTKCNFPELCVSSRTMNERQIHTSLQKLKCLQRDQNRRAHLFKKHLLTSLKNSKDNGFATKRYSLGPRTSN